MDSVLSNIRQAWPPPMTGQLQRLTRKRVLDSFPCLSLCNHDGYLALVKYLDGTPERFYSRESFRTYSDVLENEYAKNPARLKKVLNKFSDDIDRALLMLNEIGREDWHDISIENDEYVIMRLLDRTLHPAYLKLAEGVLHRLINPIASCLRLERGKKVDDLWKLSACITELTRGSLAPLVAHCDSVVRNSIAHGRITYRQNEVAYFDHKENSCELTNTAVIELIDGLVDTCHGCALALQLFYRKHLGSKIQVPRQVMLEELQADTKTPWWNIEGCLVSKLATESQLVIYARPRSRDYFKVQYMCFYSAIMAEYFSPGFDRYFISLRSPMSLPGWAVFNGRKMREVRVGGGPVALENYKDTLTGECVFYVPNIRLPRFLHKVETLLISAKIHLPLALDEFRENLQIPILSVRHAKTHRNGWRAVVDGSVVMRIPDDTDPHQLIKKSRRRIIRSARKLAVKKAGILNLAKYLPLGYTRISVFQADKRCRQMHGLGADLICTVQIQFISRIKAPDIYGSTIEQIGPYRIAWNRAWLDERVDPPKS